jgi:outer membrane protein assembly factor BamB
MDLWFAQHREEISQWDKLRSGTDREKKKALRTSRDWIGAYPDLPIPYIRLAGLLREGKQFAEAKRVLHRALQRCPTRRHIYSTLADVAAAEGDLVSVAFWTIQSFVAANQCAVFPEDRVLLHIGHLAIKCRVERVRSISANTRFTEEQASQVSRLWEAAGTANQRQIAEWLERFRDTFLGAPAIQSDLALQFVPCPACGSYNLSPTLRGLRRLVCNVCEWEFDNPLHCSPTGSPQHEAVKSRIGSYPYIGSLTLSANGSLAAWVLDGGDAGYDIATTPTTFTSEPFKIRHPGSEYPPQCAFIGDDRILVATYLGPPGERLTLYDAANGASLSEIDLPDGGSFSRRCVRHHTKTAVASQVHGVIIVEARDDKLTYRKVTGTQSWGTADNSPAFGSDGKIYFTGIGGLYRVDDDQPVEVLTGTKNCLCVDPTGIVYAGGGFEDRSAASELGVVDLINGITFAIPWGRVPIQNMKLAGDGHLLTGNVLSVPSRFPDVAVTHYSVQNRERLWTIKIVDPQNHGEPVLLAVPKENWALIQTARVLKRVCIEDGKDIGVVINRSALEKVEAQWLAAKRILCITRCPGSYLSPGSKVREAHGSLEVHRVE